MNIRKLVQSLTSYLGSKESNQGAILSVSKITSYLQTLVTDAGTLVTQGKTNLSNQAAIIKNQSAEIALLNTIVQNQQAEIVLLKKILGPQLAAVLVITNLKTGKSTTVLLKGDTKMSLVLKDDGKGASYQITGWLDADGNPAAAPALPSPPTWAVTGEVDPSGAALPPGTLASITAAADGMSASVSQNTKLGSFSVNVSVPPSTDGTFGGATGADAVQIVADVATTVQIAGTAN